MRLGSFVASGHKQMWRLQVDVSQKDQKDQKFTISLDMHQILRITLCYKTIETNSSR